GGNRQQGFQWGEIVGVVGHVRHYGMSQEGREQIYFPYWLRALGTMYVVVRSDGDAASLAPGVREAVGTIDPSLPLFEVKTLEELASNSRSGSRLNVILLGLFALVALVLAALGIYPVIYFSLTPPTPQ